ncbi:MAG: MaoC family dehydratase [Deltaproteobacteria bacterium]|nr:MaoC family dehydratase [Deltaproteobacteria bacterium]
MTANLSLPRVGASASDTLRVTAEAIENFAAATGDANPVHLDEAYAAKSFFRRRVAHGLLPATLVGKLLGTALPGPGSIYLSQTLEFKAPVFIGDSLAARVAVLAVDEKSAKIRLQTTVANQRGELVLSGEALVLYKPPA